MTGVQVNIVYEMYSWIGKNKVFSDKKGISITERPLIVDGIVIVLPVNMNNFFIFHYLKPNLFVSISSIGYLITKDVERNLVRIRQRWKIYFQTSIYIN